MLDLDSPHWEKLDTFEGNPGDLPAMIRRLERDVSPPARFQDSVWERLWSMLQHQGEVAGAAFAVAPHLVRIASESRQPFFHDYIGLPAYIEILRGTGAAPPLPDELAAPYFEAIGRLPEVVASRPGQSWSDEESRAFCAGILAARKQYRLAGLLIFLSVERMDELLEEEGFARA